MFYPRLGCAGRMVKSLRCGYCGDGINGRLLDSALPKIGSCRARSGIGNAHTLKHVPGRKTDVQDCQWIQQLHTYGLLRASFRPDELTCRLRTLVRHRANTVSRGAEYILQMQKALTQMNVQLHHVVSHLTGETGLRILRAILNGQRDPLMFVELRDPQITRSTKEEMRKALVGDWRPELLFVLKQSLRGWEFCQEHMRECDGQM